MSNNKFKKSLLQMFTGESVTFVSSFIAGYFFALILGPNDYGIWQTAKILISYSVIFSFSLPFVMRRDFIMLRAEGKNSEAEKIANLVFTYELIVTPIIAISLMSYAIFFINEYLLKISIITVSLIYISQFIGGFSNIVAKGMNNYKLIKNASLLNGILVILSILFVYKWGIRALLLSTLIISIINSIYYYSKRPFNFNFYWDNKLFKNLLLISFPLYIQDISTTVFDSIDRIIIAKYLSFSEVGLYSLASIVVVPLRLLIASISLVLFTHLNSKNGFSKSNKIISDHVVLPHKMLSIVIPPILGIALILLPIFVSIFLPKYNNGIVSSQISLVATFIYLLTSFSANGLFVAGLQKKTATIFLFIGILKSLMCYYSVYYGFGINGVSISTLIVFLLLDFLMLFTVFKYLDKTIIEFIKFYIAQIIPITYVSLTVMIYYYWIIPILNEHFDFYKINIIGLLYIILITIPLFINAYKTLKKQNIFN